MRRRTLSVTLLALTAATAAMTGPANAACQNFVCDEPDVATGQGVLLASYVSQSGGNWVASNATPENHPYTYRLRNTCEIDTAAGGSCRPDADVVCPAPPNAVAELLVVEQCRLVLPDGTTGDGFDRGDAVVYMPFGSWMTIGLTCVDITAMNPLPSPGQVFRHFQTLPLLDLPTH